MKHLISPRRFWTLMSLVAALFLIVVYQLVQRTVTRRPALLELADKQHLIKIDVPPLRGQIVDRAGREFATNLQVPSIYAVPRLLDKSEIDPLAEKLSVILGLDPAYLKERLSRDKSFVWLKRRTTYEEAEKVKALQTEALGMTREYRRFYPQGDMLANVLGFTNIDSEGIEGIELQHNKELSGRAGQRMTKRDAMGREIKAYEIKQSPVIDGHRITLTIDQHLQYLAERAIDKAYKQWKPKGAMAVILEARTGRVLALVNRPTFDPNKMGNSIPDMRRNRILTDMYEPGSVFKIVAVSGALNEGVVTPETTFNCENGAYRYSGSRVLHDVHPYGILSLADVVSKSSNIGTVKIAAKLSPKIFQSYITSFGFGKATGMDLPGEAPGYTRPPEQWSNTSPYNIPIGQEIMVTALQMAQALSVIANDGLYIAPYIIEKVEDQSGVVLRTHKAKPPRPVIRPEIAKTMRQILTKVVNEGTGKSAQIKGIPVGGKTGTAQKVLANGRGYSHSNFVGSFIGIAPSDKPEYIMAVVIDDPHPMYYGGVVAAPVFKEVMEVALLSKGYVPQNAEKFGAEVKNGAAGVKSPQGNPPKLPPARVAGTRISPR